MSRRSRSNAALDSFNPLKIIETATGFTDSIPDVIEFTMSDRYLNRPMVYPRQATLLKLVFLQRDLLTDYDYEVIDEWADSYRRTMDDKGEGTNGIVPDVLERLAICLEEGRRWFRETVFAGGRRGSKGHIGGIGGSYVLWHFLARGDPQGFYGVDRDKQLVAQVFAGKKEQARANQWQDLVNMILGSNCFTGGLGGTNYIAKNLNEGLELYAPHDFARMLEFREKGLDLAGFNPSFLIEPRESTVMAARGPAAFMQFYDEMAHIVRGVAKVDAKEVWDSATPGLDQFGIDAFIWEPSSPWQRMGQFYANYEKALEHDEEGRIANPQVLMVQLASWDIYKDYERTQDPALGLVARPERWYSEPMPALDFDEIEQWLADNEFESTTITEDGDLVANRIEPPIPFTPLARAIQEFNTDLEREEKANPETFRVERRAHFANVLDAYLDPDVVANIWRPWPTPNDVLVMQSRGILSVAYRAHGDPSKSGKNFGISVAHIAGKDERGFSHVVFDRIHHWSPGDFDNHRIDYDAIEQQIKDDYLDPFMPEHLTFDQYPMGSTLAHLQAHVAGAHYPRQVQVYERNATNELNWRTYEAFKTAAGLGLVHAPFYEQANAELLFLQDLGRKKVDHPTSGPVQTKDVADTMAILVYELIGSEISEFWANNLASVPLGGSQPGGIVTAAQAAQQPEAIQQLAAFGRHGRTAPGAAPRSRRRR